MGGDEVPHYDWNWKEKSVFANSPACRRLIEKNAAIPNAKWQTFAPTKFHDLQPYFTKKFMKILIDHGFSPAAWEEPWTYGAACAKNKSRDREMTDCVRPISDFIDTDMVNVYAFNWNVDFEFK